MLYVIMSYASYHVWYPEHPNNHTDLLHFLVFCHGLVVVEIFRSRFYPKVRHKSSQKHTLQWRQNKRDSVSNHLIEDE